MNKNNKIALVIFAIIFFSFSALNIFQPARATFSEDEKRELAKFPEFTYEKLIKGEYLKGIEEFISDTFIFRSDFILLSRKITSLWSANTFFSFGHDEIIFIPSKTPVTEVSTETPTPNIPQKEPELGEENKPKIEESNNEPVPSEKEEPQQGEKEDNPSETDSNENTDAPSEESEDLPEINLNPNEKLTEIEDPVGVGEPEFLSSGEIIYNGAVISIPYLVKNVAQYYADVVNYYQDLFPKSSISVICAPLSSSMVDDPKLKSKITDQNNMITTINSYLDKNINGVNCFEELYSHRNEYLYFKSDHHWTSRGAYYAYKSFAESVGLTPTPLENFNEVLMNDKWNGSMYYMTGDPRVKEILDEVYAYVPTKEHTMTVYDKDGSSRKYNSAILTKYNSYDGFLEGDNPYTVISVPENPKDMTVLVFEDSYGRAFVPYLVEHYSTIIIVDPRYIYFDVYEHLKDYPIKDIIFVNNLYNPNVISYPKNLMRAIGK